MHRLPKMSAKSPSPTGCVLDLWAAFETDTSPEVARKRVPRAAGTGLGSWRQTAFSPCMVLKDIIPPAGPPTDRSTSRSNGPPLGKPRQLIGRFRRDCMLPCLPDVTLKPPSFRKRRATRSCYGRSRILEALGGNSKRSWNPVTRASLTSTSDNCYLANRHEHCVSSGIKNAKRSSRIDFPKDTRAVKMRESRYPSAQGAAVSIVTALPAVGNWWIERRHGHGMCRHTNFRSSLRTTTPESRMKLSELAAV